MDRREIALTGLGLGLCVGFACAITLGAVADPAPFGADQEGEGVQAAASDTVNKAAVDKAFRETPVTRAVEAVAPSVVSITTEQPTAGLFHSQRRSQSEDSEGSGVIIDSDGVILTNAHVVATASRITVGFSDGQQSDAVVIGLAEDLDLAVLRVPVRPLLKAAKLGTSTDLILGEPVIAIGNPFGLGHTVTTGVVSATSRALETDNRVFQDFIQTDASINPGNSGGALLNANGQLIGITTAIRPDAEGIGFAIPIDRAYKIAQDLVEDGTVQLPFLGVMVEDVRVNQPNGFFIRPQVVSTIGSRQEGQGLQPGDLIQTIEGRPVQSRADLNAFLAAFSPGEALKLTVARSQQVIDVTVKSGILADSLLDEHLQNQIGLTLKDNHFGQGHAVVSIARVKRQGTGERLGLRAGDLLLGVDGTRVSSSGDVKSAIRKALARHRSTILITVRRGRAQGRVALPL